MKLWKVISIPRPGTIGNASGNVKFKDEEMAKDYKKWCDINANSHVNRVIETDE